MGVSAVTMGALLTTYAGAIRTFSYARAFTPAAASCSLGATPVADDTALQAAVASSVDGSVICVTTDITLTATLNIDDTTLTLEGRDVGGRNPVVSGDYARRVINADFTDNTSDDTLTLRDLALVQGRAAGEGGAVLLVGGNRSDALVITGSEIANNYSTSDGGGVSAGNLASVYVANSNFHDDTVGDSAAGDISGGALSVQNTAQTTITGSYFRDNSSVEWGGAVYLNDSGITRIIGSTFERNSSGTQAGGAIEFDIDDSSLPGALYVSSTVFRDNSSTSGSGGAVRVEDNDDTVSFSSVTFDGNSTGSFSGGGLRISSQSGPVFLSDITAIDNSAGSNGGFLHISGSAPTLLIERLDSQRNSANSDGGSIKQTSGVLEVRDSTFADDSASDGGAIYSESLSLARVSNSHFIGNYASDDAGGLMVRNSDSVYVAGTNFENNVAAGDDGGGLLINNVDDTISLTSNQLINNSAQAEGGGVKIVGSDGYVAIDNASVSGNRAGSEGGGIYINDPRTMMIRDSVFSANYSAADGGALYIDNNDGVADSQTLTGLTFTDDSANGFGGAIYAWSEGPIRISDVSGTNTSAGADGGFAYLRSDDSSVLLADFYLTDVTVTGSSSGRDGGAFAVLEADSLTATRLDISGSTAASDGGGIIVVRLNDIDVSESQVTGNTAVQDSGGGVSLFEVHSSATLDYVTVSNNSAEDDGAGLYADLYAGVTLAVTNSTISGNSLSSSGTGRGGGVFITNSSPSPADVSLDFVTISANSGKTGGGIHGDDFDLVTRNSVIAGNAASVRGTDVELGGTTSLDDSYSLFTSANAVSGATIDGPGSLFGAPKLNGLADNGGPTLSMLPQWDSPAFQAGDPNWGAPPANDQRGTGFPRDAGGRVSMGAIQGRSAKPIDPVFPPSAPREVQAVAGDEQAVVTWKAPASIGSFPATTYQVDDSTGEISVLVSVTPGEPLSTVIEDLVNGSEYAFRVRALNGAGWGTWSDYSDTVIPQPGPSILISGTRDGRFARVRGETTGLVGQSMIPRVRLPGPLPYQDGVARPVVDGAGEFTWQRQGGKKVYVYFFTEDLQLRSNRVIIPAQR